MQSAITTRTGACLLCGATRGPAVLAENGFVGRSCPCGIVYIDPVPEAGRVDPTDDAHLAGYYELPARRRLAWARRYAPTGRFLDVGCGSGALVAEARRLGYEVEAVEPDPARAALVAERFGVPVETALIEESNLPDGRFDLIYHVDLMSHFADPLAALVAMGRRLRPTGTMCFEVGLFGGLAPGWYRWTGRPKFPAHRWFFSESALRTLLARAGLEVVAVRSFAIAPSTVVSTALRRALPAQVEAVPVTDDVGPPRGSLAARAYARSHDVLRYQVGAVLPIPGPRTAFVAARPAGPAR